MVLTSKVKLGLSFRECVWPRGRCRWLLCGPRERKSESPSLSGSGWRWGGGGGAAGCWEGLSF